MRGYPFSISAWECTCGGSAYRPGIEAEPLELHSQAEPGNEGLRARIRSDELEGEGGPITGGILPLPVIDGKVGRQLIFDNP